MSERLCPITAEPLPLTDQKAVVSWTACEQFQNLTSDIVITMQQVQDRIHGVGKPKTDGHAKTQGPRTPLDLGILNEAQDMQDSITIWAIDILQNTLGNVSIMRGDWEAIQRVYQTFNDLTHYPAAPQLIDDVTYAINRLKKLADPPKETPWLTGERLEEAKTKMLDKQVSIGKACQMIRLITGKTLPRQTIYSWERRGQLQAIDGTPKRYRIGDLLALREKETA